MRRRLTAISGVLLALFLAAPVAQACGFLVAENGAVRLGKTTTFVAWEDGIEHYITNFTFEGDVESFGSIIPLPAEPTDVKKAGSWTLQRLGREVNPPELRFFGRAVASEAASDVEVILETRIDSLDVVVLKGGGAAVLDWVNENGFDLPPGPATTHLLEYYASRSPYFLAARFDFDAAAEDGFVSGDGIPVQIEIPTDRPWVPLHILHGASPDSAIINADVFVLTPERPRFLHGQGLTLEHSDAATQELLDDLRSDENMEWVPSDGWLSYLVLATEAENLVYDLAIGVDGQTPSLVDAGFARFDPTDEQLRSLGLARAETNAAQLVAALALLLLVGGAGAVAWRFR